MKLWRLNLFYKMRFFSLMRMDVKKCQVFIFDKNGFTLYLLSTAFKCYNLHGEFKII